MFILTTIAILITIGLALIRAISGPSTYDRILALNYGEIIATGLPEEIKNKITIGRPTKAHTNFSNS